MVFSLALSRATFEVKVILNTSLAFLGVMTLWNPLILVKYLLICWYFSGRLEP